MRSNEFKRFLELVEPYIGKCKEPANIVEGLVERIGFEKMSGQGGFTDYDPLIFVLRHTAGTMERSEIDLSDTESKYVWQSVVKSIQAGDAYLEHNTRIPCWKCDSAFEPEIDDHLFDLFMTYYQTRSTESFVKIHTCQPCGGTINSLEQVRYSEDMHTPSPNTILDSDAWAKQLMNCSYV